MVYADEAGKAETGNAGKRPSRNSRQELIADDGQDVFFPACPMPRHPGRPESGKGRGVKDVMTHRCWIVLRPGDKSMETSRISERMRWVNYCPRKVGLQRLRPYTALVVASRANSGSEILSSGRGVLVVEHGNFQVPAGEAL